MVILGLSIVHVLISVRATRGYINLFNFYIQYINSNGLIVMLSHVCNRKFQTDKQCLKCGWTAMDGVEALLR